MVIFFGVIFVDNIFFVLCRLIYGDVVYERCKLFILCGIEMNGEVFRYNI